MSKIIVAVSIVSLREEEEVWKVKQLRKKATGKTYLHHKKGEHKSRPGENKVILL